MTAMNRVQQRALALAGVLQATHLADQVARSGQIDAAAFNTIVHSLFSFDPDSPEAVYGGTVGLRPGLQLLRDLLRGERRPDQQQALRYAMGVLYLQQKLAKEPQMQALIRSRLQHVERKLEHFTQDINEISASVAGIYQDTISHFKYRIQISGSPQLLQDSNNANRIRALLLAAIRSAVLWRQVGGRRWQLLVQRGALAQATQQLLNG